MNQDHTFDPAGVIQMLQMNEKMFRANLRGVDDRAARAHPIRGANSILWIAGHVTYWRNRMLGVAGTAPAWDAPTIEAFRGQQEQTEPPKVTAWTLEAVLAAYDIVTRALTDATKRASVDVVEGSDKAPGLRALATHEAYHIGQLGLLRRAIGLPGAF